VPNSNSYFGLWNRNLKKVKKQGYEDAQKEDNGY